MRLYKFLILGIIALCTLQNTQSTQPPVQNAFSTSITKNRMWIAGVRVHTEIMFTADTEFIANYIANSSQYKTRLYEALEEDVFRPEMAKRDEMAVLLAGELEVQCIDSYKAAIDKARTTVKSQFEYCENNVRQDIFAVRNDFNIKRDKIRNELAKTDILLDRYKRTYDQGYDLNVYNDSVGTLRYNLQKVLATYNSTSVRGSALQRTVIDLGACTDGVLQALDVAFNNVYRNIHECLSNSGNTNTKSVLIPFLQTYKFNLSYLNLEKEISRAIEVMKLPAGPILQTAAALNATLNEARLLVGASGLNERKNRLELLDAINLRRMSLQQASIDLANYYMAIQCLVGGQYDLSKEVTNSGDTVGSLCVNDVRSFKMIQKNILDLGSVLRKRDAEEGLIALMNCFKDKKNMLKKNGTASCAIDADLIYQKFVSRIDKQLQVSFTAFREVYNEYYKCQQGRVYDNILGSLEVQKNTFEECVRTNAIPYKLKG